MTLPRARERVFYVANTRLPTERANGLQVMLQTSALAERADVTLVVPRRDNPTEGEPFSFYGMRPSFPIAYAWCIDLQRRARRLQPLWFVVQAFTFFAAARMTVPRGARVHLRDPVGLLFFPGATCELHDGVLRRAPWMRFLLGRARRLFPLTQGIEAEIEQLGIAVPRTVLPDAVDLGRFSALPDKAEARRHLGLAQDAFIAAYAGSLYTPSYKGVDTLIDAVALLPEVFSGLVVGGTADDVARASSRPHASRTAMVGRQPYARVPLYLVVADVLVLPNLPGDAASERYTSPLKLFEYAATRIPIVASDLPSLREALPGDAALFVAPGDPKALAAGIRAIKEDPDAAHARAARARTVAEARTWDGRAKEILA